MFKHQRNWFLLTALVIAEIVCWCFSQIKKTFKILFLIKKYKHIVHQWNTGNITACLCVYVCLSVCVCISLYVYLCVYISTLYSSSSNWLNCATVCLSVCLSLCLSICVCISMYVWITLPYIVLHQIGWAVPLSVSLSVCPYVYIS